jgi:hypothetical protein
MSTEKKGIILTEEQEKAVTEGRFDHDALVAARKTNLEFTSSANVRGNKITAIDPAYQQALAEEVWGLYGSTWGLRNMDVDVIDAPGNPNKFAYMKAIFWYPGGQFPIMNGILTGSYAQGKFDPEWPKKLETNTISKALSRLGFNRDVFLGRFDDERYVQALRDEIEAASVQTISEAQAKDLREKLKMAGMSEDDFKKALSLDDLGGLPAARFPAAIKRLLEKAEARAKKADVEKAAAIASTARAM